MSWQSNARGGVDDIDGQLERSFEPEALECQLRIDSDRLDPQLTVAFCFISSTVQLILHFSSYSA